MTKTPSDTSSNSQGFKPPAGGRLIWTLLILMAGGGLFIAHQQRQQQLQFQSLTEQMAALQRSQAELSVRIEQRLVAAEGRVAKLESSPLPASTPIITTPKLEPSPVDAPPPATPAPVVLPPLVQGTVAEARLKKLESELSRLQQQDLADLKKKQKQLGEQVAGLDVGLKAAAAERESIGKTLRLMKSQIAEMIKLLPN